MSNIPQVDVPTILADDGVSKSIFDQSNIRISNILNIISSMPSDSSWSYTLVDSPSNSATLIAQLEGEGNRRHFHPDWDEWWLILQGSWAWEINGEVNTVNPFDLVFIKRNSVHKITSLHEGLSIRLAVSRYDVVHDYDC